MVRRILVPLDGSGLAEASLPYVRAVARAFPARILLLRVLAAGSEARGERSHLAWRSARAEADSYLDEVAARFADAEVPSESRLASGRASEEILATARSWDADMIVLTTHGRGGSKSFGLGGTAHKILSAAPTSVLLVRIAAESMEPRSFEGLRRILVPVDGSARAQWAVCLAAAVARANEAELLLLHVVPRPELLGDASEAGSSAAEEIVERNREEAQRQLAALKRQIDAPDLPVRTLVRVASNVPRAIDEAAAEEGASLVVCAAHGRSGHEAWPYGSVAGALLDHGHAPILVFQDLPSGERGEAPFRGRGSVRAPRPQASWTG